MEILKEITQVLFQNETIEKAIKQFQTKSQKIPVDTENVSFRLFLTPRGSINLELMGRDECGYYFKPVGYYTFNNQGVIEAIYILKEYSSAFESVKLGIDNQLTNLVKPLSLEEDTYIGLCSRETSNLVKKMFNSPKYDTMNHMFPNKFQIQNIQSNGLNIRVKTSMMGALEAGLNDGNYELEEDIFVMYQNNDGISLHCQEQTYIDLHAKSLLGAFK